MGNHSYQASSIIGGVSLQEYSLRLDSQAFLQENCMLSPRYGLCKRPGSQWLANAGYINDTLTPPAGTEDYLYSLLDYKLITLYSGYSEYVALLTSGAQIYVKDTDGVALQTAYWPKVGPTFDGDNSYYLTPSYSHYMSAGFGPISEDTVSHTTIGDVTFINNSNIQPEMTFGSEWMGYNEDVFLEDPQHLSDGRGVSLHQIIRRNITVSNDDVFAVWIKRAATGSNDVYNITVKCRVTDPITGYYSSNGEITFSAEVKGMRFDNSKDGYMAKWQGQVGHPIPGFEQDNGIQPDYTTIATHLAYHLNSKSYWNGVYTLVDDPAGDPLNPCEGEPGCPPHPVQQRLGMLIEATNLQENSPNHDGTSAWVGPQAVWWDTHTGAMEGVHGDDGGVEFSWNGERGSLYHQLNVVPPGYASPGNEGVGATSVVTGRYLGVNGEQGYVENASRFNSTWPLVSVSSGNEASQSNISICWKTVDSIAELPPRSWEDHTVEISAEKDADDVFYMRFVSDGEPVLNIMEGQRNLNGNTTHTNYSTGWSMYPTTKLPRIGHWEEYCATGIKTEINASTMPHLLIKRDGFDQHLGFGNSLGTDDVARPGSFVAAPAGGAFQVNKYEDSVVFHNHNPTEVGPGEPGGPGSSVTDPSCGPNGELHITGSLGLTFDNGFTASVQGTVPSDDDCTILVGEGCTVGTYSYDVYPLIPGDTIRFEPVDSLTLSTESFLKKLGYKLYTDYYIICIHPSDRTGGNIREATVMLSESPGGAPVNHAGNMASNQSDLGIDLKVVVTTYEKFGWGSRVAGDENSNPEPDFLSRPIQSLSSYQDRLVLATDTTVTVSGTGDYFNFFRTTVRDLVDSDPFSLVPAADEGATIKHCVPYKGNLIVFTTNEQHVIHGADGAFAPSTAEILPATKATADFFVRPQAVGDELFFPHVTSSGTDLWRFHASAQYRGQYATTDISEQVPGYLPRSIYRLSGSSKHKMLFALCTAGATDYLDTGTGLSPGADQELYIYNWARGADGSLLQSAWTKWKFSKTWDTDSPRHPNDFKIRSMVMGVDRLYLLTQSWYKYEDPGDPPGSHTYPLKCQFNIEYIDLDLDATDALLYDNLEDNFNNILIDRKTLGWAHTIEGSTSPIGVDWNTEEPNATTLTLPWPVTGPLPGNEDEGPGQVHDLVVVLPNGRVYISNTYDGPNNILQYPATVEDDQIGDGGGGENKKTVRYEKVVLPDVNLTTLVGGTSFFWVGLSYNMKSSVGPFVPKIGDKPIRGRNIFMRGARLTYSQAYQYRIEQTNGGTDYSQLVDAGRRVAFGGTIDEPNLGNGELYFGLRQFMPDLSYTIINDTPWNAMFQGIMYDLNVQEIKPEYSRGSKGSS